MRESERKSPGAYSINQSPDWEECSFLVGKDGWDMVWRYKPNPIIFVFALSCNNGWRFYPENCLDENGVAKECSSLSEAQRLAEAKVKSG